MLEFTLADDGTLDTVVDVHCSCGQSWQERFSQEYAANFRDDDTGEMIGLEPMMAENDIYCECEE